MYLFDMLDISEYSSCLMLKSSIVDFLILKNCLVCLLHVINLNFIYSVTFISFLSFLFSRFFIMLKYCFNYFFLTQFILVENIQISFLCNCCAKQKKSCIVSDKLNKYSEYVCLKKSCLFSFNLFVINVA